MSSRTQQIRGKLNSTIGQVKQSAGKASGNRVLQGKGVLQLLKGKAQSVHSAVLKGKEAALQQYRKNA